MPLIDGYGWRVRLEHETIDFVDLMRGPQTQTPSAQCGDVLVRDRLNNWTYQWAVTVDDWLQGVTHVIRGEDLLDSTGRQIQLARLMGRAEPPAFLHHPLVMKSPTQKLSKSDGDTAIRDLRARGLTLVGWVANQIDPAMPHQRDNIDALRSRLSAPLLGAVRWMTAPTAAEAAAVPSRPSGVSALSASPLPAQSTSFCASARNRSTLA